MNTVFAGIWLWIGAMQVAMGVHEGKEGGVIIGALAFLCAAHNLRSKR